MMKGNAKVMMLFEPSVIFPRVPNCITSLLFTQARRAVGFLTFDQLSATRRPTLLRAAAQRRSGVSRNSNQGSIRRHGYHFRRSFVARQFTSQVSFLAGSRQFTPGR